MHSLRSLLPLCALIVPTFARALTAQGTIFPLPTASEEGENATPASTVIGEDVSDGPSASLPMADGPQCPPAAKRHFDLYDCSADIARRQTGDLVMWLQGMNDYTVYEGNHQGRWSEGDQLLFSIDGQSYRQNAFVLDGFRINNRTTSGSTLYPQLFEHYRTQVDPASAYICFSDPAGFCTEHDYARVMGNFGNLGGINPTTIPLIHTFHGTGSEDLYRGFGADSRQHVRGAGTLDALFSSRRGKHLLSASFANRQLPLYDHNGLVTASPLYGANHYRVQAHGVIRTEGLFDRIGYLANVSGKEDGYSEFYLNPNEMPRLDYYSASVYGHHQRHNRIATEWTTGLTWATTSVRHDDLGFSRNMVDQDGESLEPWMPNGLTHEFSWSYRGHWQFKPWLSLSAEAYNSLVSHSPSQREWTNEVFMQMPGQAVPTPLYRYEWKSQPYTGAILENQVVLQAQHAPSDDFSFGGYLGLSLDGMLLSAHSKVTPCPVGKFEFNWFPKPWLNVRAILTHDRMRYDIETLRFMSDRYMNADVYTVADNRLFTQTGGAHHSYKSGLWQTSYTSLIIPITFRFGHEQRHEIALIQTYRKFYNAWMTQFAGGAAANGYNVDTPISAEVQQANKTPDQSFAAYYLIPGQREYVVGNMPKGFIGDGFLANTPYYVSQQTRYTYHGRKVEVGVSWQSMQGVGFTGLGNGPGINNVGVLSESTANPNTHFVMQNAPTGNRTVDHPAAGRTDQDRAYIVRIPLSYIINKHWQVGGVGTWVDGQAFSYYRIYSNTEGTGKPEGQGKQYCVIPCSPRGINPTDGNFGSRESGIFNIDVFVRANWEMHGRGMEFMLQSYNIYDFGNVYNEFCFPQTIREGRGHNMCLTIPRGVIASFKINL